MSNKEEELKQLAKEIRKKVKFDYTEPAKELAKHVTRLEGLEGDKALERARNLLYTKRKYR